MSKLTVAQLIGETPEMLKLCGKVILAEHEQQEAIARHMGTESTFRAFILDAHEENVREARYWVRRAMETQRENVRGPLMTNWTDEEIDVYLAVYGKGVCDK